MFFTSKEAAKITNCTLRQLQYWREKKVIEPTVGATGKGRSVFYTEEDLVSLCVMQCLLSSGLDFQEAHAGLIALKSNEPEFNSRSQKKRFMLSKTSVGSSLTLMKFDLSLIEKSLKAGLPIIPLWLDRIHFSLQQNLDKLERYNSENFKRQQVSKWEEHIQRIDSKITNLNPGWIAIEYRDDLNTSELERHAVKKYPTMFGYVDYALFVEGQLLGLIEVKRVSTNYKAGLEQAKHHSKSVLENVGNWRDYRIPFLFSSNGKLIHFLDLRYKKNASKQLNSFYTPDALLELFKRDRDYSYRWLTEHSIKESSILRPYQIDAISLTESAIMKGKRKLLIAMPTGTGKTFYSISQIYRLLESKAAKRVLFLVGTSSSVFQAASEFASFNTFKGNNFSQEYEVYSQNVSNYGFKENNTNMKVLPNGYLTKPNETYTFVYITTIKEIESNLSRLDLADNENEVSTKGEIKKKQQNVPIHAFDLVIANECFYECSDNKTNTWSSVIDYFDAIKIGLTASPATHTTSFFKEIVYRYTVEQAVKDGWLVDYERINIDSDIEISNHFIKKPSITSFLTEPGKFSYDQIEDERPLKTKGIESKLSTPDFNRKLIEEVARYVKQHEKETGAFPKTLIYAENDLPDDSHAPLITSICKEVFNIGNNFVQKIAEKPSDLLCKIQEFKNSPQPKIAVVTDLTDTGIDFPNVELVVLMRPVNSRSIWVQMIGRAMIPCPDIHKTHLTVIDCFGGSLISYFVDSTDFKFKNLRYETEHKHKSVKEIIDEIVHRRYGIYRVGLLTRRLHRIHWGMSDEAKEMFGNYIPEGNVRKFAQSLPIRLRKDWTITANLLQDEGFQHLLENYPKARHCDGVPGLNYDLDPQNINLP